VHYDLHGSGYIQLRCTAWIRLFNKNWCDRGCGTGFNTSETWPRSLGGSITTDYGYATENELRSSDARCCYCFREHTSQWGYGRGY